MPIYSKATVQQLQVRPYAEISNYSGTKSICLSSKARFRDGLRTDKLNMVADNQCHCLRLEIPLEQ